MLDLQILRICVVLDVEELLHLLYALCSQVDDLILFIYDEISRLLLLNAHNGIQLGEILHVGATL